MKKAIAQNNVTTWRLQNLPRVLGTLDQAIRTSSENGYSSISHVIEDQWFEQYRIKKPDVPEIRTYYENLGFKTGFYVNSCNGKLYVNISWYE